MLLVGDYVNYMIRISLISGYYSYREYIEFSRLAADLWLLEGSDIALRSCRHLHHIARVQHKWERVDIRWHGVAIGTITAGNLIVMSNRAAGSLKRFFGGAGGAFTRHRPC